MYTRDFKFEDHIPTQETEDVESSYQGGRELRNK